MARGEAGDVALTCKSQTAAGSVSVSANGCICASAIEKCKVKRAEASKKKTKKHERKLKVTGPGLNRVG